MRSSWVNPKSSGELSDLSRIVPVWLLGLFLGLWSTAVQSAANSPHCVIFSGQSNMVALNVETHVLPYWRQTSGDDADCWIKLAKNGQAIEKWVEPQSFGLFRYKYQRGPLYLQLQQKLRQKLQARLPGQLSLVWIQGESDARDEGALQYAGQVNQLLNFIREDFRPLRLNLIIARINDHGLNSSTPFPFWREIRQQQLLLAQQANSILIDTDSYNDVTASAAAQEDALHFSPDGYVQLGQLIAESLRRLALCRN